MAKDRALYIGPRLRRLRRDLGLTQAAMAGDLEISPSYIALLERNQRPLTADLLLRLANAYQIDLNTFAGDSSDETSSRMKAVLSDPLFTDLDLAPMEAEEAASGFPAVTEAFLRLYTAYQEGQLAIADQGGERMAAIDPVAEAQRFLEARRNSFPNIDGEAEKLIAAMDGFENLPAYFADRHNLHIRRLPVDVMVGAMRRLDRHRNEIVLDETLDRASENFQLALQLVYLELGTVIDGYLQESSFVTENGKRLTRRALANYSAAALLMPYRPFLKSAEMHFYDVEALARQFGTSFEQTAHRLTTLQNPGREGVPFFFIRVDPAGNVSKRLDSAGFPFARHGGSCPLWSVHEAFQSPRRIITQWVELPDGEKFFSIARTVTAGGGSYGAPRVERAIALGCAEKHTKRLIYSKDLDLDRLTPTPIGVTCRLCHRTKCTARSAVPIGRDVLREDYRRTVAPFGFSDG